MNAALRGLTTIDALALDDAAFIGVVLPVRSALGGWQDWRAEQQSRNLHARNELLLLAAGVLSALLLHAAARYLCSLQRLLGVAPLTATEWIVMPLAALTLLVVMELQKRSWARRVRAVDLRATTPTGPGATRGDRR